MSSPWTWIVVTAIFQCCCNTRGALASFFCGKGVTTKMYSECKLLPALDASLAWTLDTSSNSIDFAFTEDLSSSTGWVAWGVNPSSPQMVGTQALGAFRNSTGVTVETYDVTLAVKNFEQSLVPGPVTAAFSNYSASVTDSGSVTISGTLQLQAGQSTTLNLVWNRGPTVVAATAALSSHPFIDDNTASTAVVDMASGVQTGGGHIPNKRLKQIHGILNAVSWGFLLPIGAMVARYLRPFAFADPAWFYLHMFCQLTAYAGGTAGWIIGLKLQKVAHPIKYTHRNLGIVIWALATFQIVGAILLRPMKKHKRRIFWDVMHHAIGYAVIILAIVNIFEGIHVLSDRQWKRTFRRIYILVLVVLGLLAVVLELITWFHWLQKRSRKKHKHSQLVGDAQ